MIAASQPASSTRRVRVTDGPLPICHVTPHHRANDDDGGKGRGDPVVAGKDNLGGDNTHLGPPPKTD